MTFEDFCKLPDADKIVVAEAKFPFELNTKTWTAGSGSSYYASCATEGEVSAVQENGTDLARAASEINCGATAGSFFYDHANSRIYVRTTGGDAPDASDSNGYLAYLQAFTWVGFTDRQFDDTPVIYTPQDATQPIYYEPFLDTEAMATIEQAVGEYHIGDIAINFGPVRFFNDGYFYRASRKYTLHNFDLVLKIGARGSAYADLEPIFVGLASDPETTDESCTVQVADPRFSTLKEIPYNRFEAGDYPNLGVNLEGAVIPILVGEVEGIQPPCCDTAAFTHKVHDGDAFGAIEEISGIEVDGVAAAATVDLAAGEFSLNADPGNGVVTCNAKGAKCAIGTGAYSYLAGDIAYYILRTLNGIAEAKLDTPEFQALNAARTQKLGWWFNSGTATIEALRAMMRSCAFHVVPLLDGTFSVRYYETGTPSGTPVVDDIELANYRRLEKTSATIKRVLVGYAYQPKTQRYIYAKAVEETTGYKYRKHETLTIGTWIRGSGDAAVIAAFLLAMNKRPPIYIGSDLPAAGLGMVPTDKIILSHSMETIDQGTIEVESAEVYRALKIGKNVGQARADIWAIRDDLAAGQFHADEDHEDSHSDGDHQDVAHGDGSHEDHQDDIDHGDFTHTDTTHADNPYIDYEEYADEGHLDHWDVPHQDGPTIEETTHIDITGYEDHDDSEHADSAHADVAHLDAHSDDDHQDSQI